MPPKSKLRQFKEHQGHFSLVRNFHLADLFTIMNGVCGVGSLFSSAHYLIDSSNKQALYFALTLPAFGFLFDALDGKVARWRKSSSMLGQELDSLADLISFGVAPAFLAFAIGLRGTIDMMMLTGFVCAGLARLARFNATVANLPKDASGKSKYFEGLPIPSSLGLVAYMAYLIHHNLIQDDIPLGFHYKVIHPLSLVFGLWGAAMVSKTLRVPKL
ncbi:hypothetical protein E3P99_02479 [Wallemia hederae]|uniref:CDP-diacylglycerol--serine O-phosphatidyltransferase n=1 Tax=Wallemia hederae TaxID=1540922 RepID=A0A4T0FK91_9BASI|nr:hypothetical protein E3P99_02479 [Wallemia hederae]